jgi:hypothetical protein
VLGSEGTELERRAVTFSRDLLRVDHRGFGATRAVLYAVLVVAPLAVGFAVGLPEASVLVTVGALNLLLVEANFPTLTRTRVLLVATGTNALAFGAGTLVGLLPRTLELPFVAAGIFLALFGRHPSEWESSRFIAAVMFVFAVGVPPTVPLGVILRPGAILLGGVWVLSALAVVSLLSRRASPGLFARAREAGSPPAGAGPRSALPAAMVAVTAAVGLLIGLELGLPRDYWVMLTVIVALRPDLSGTIAYGTARTLGTVVGAAGAFVVTTATSAVWFLFPILAATTILAFAFRGVNYLVYSVGITLTIILLLNLVYSGGPALAVARVVDTAIGGSLALVAALLVYSFGPRTDARGPRTP